ncbi:uncharacterized protein LOC108740099 isoform X2 [Agrilus planipennis]|uniref:Uncharacterized protein LOC108740099 isoform X2 n=1 Tax=Agrilus planipennis TaxID=224129 RepID=A0A1W4XBJ8_AGRPL|nr:uncharacterized protein LOC108740099 isoform X2 [Agrilus planipennis]
MRIKSSDSSVYLNNGNDPQRDLLNSPKRLNTIQNSRITPATRPTSFLHQLNNVNSKTPQIILPDDNSATTRIGNRTTAGFLGDDQENATAVLTEVLDKRILRWYSDHQGRIGNNTAQERTNNINNLQRQRQLNINNNVLDTTTPIDDYVAPSSICSESPDDSFIDYEEHQHYSSSPLEDISPKEREIDEEDDEEDEDASASESFTGSNLSVQADVQLQRGGIVNPNYPGFQDFAIDLDFYSKTISDTDLVEYETIDVADNNTETIEHQSLVNNNNVEDKDKSIDEIANLNCLDTNESLPKVFYEKEIFNIPPEENSRIKSKTDSDFQEENTQHASKVDDSLLNQVTEPERDCTALIRSETFICDKKALVEELSEGLSKPLGDYLESVKNTDLELKEAAEKLQISDNLKPSATVYRIEPNINEPFSKSISNQSTTMATMSMMRQSNDEHFTQDAKSKDGTLKRNTMEFIPNKVTISDSYKTKLADAFLSGTGDKIPQAPDFSNPLPDYNANNNETVMEVDIPWIKKGLDLRCGNYPTFVNEEREMYKKEEQVFQLGINSKGTKFGNELYSKLHQKNDEPVIPRKKEKVEMAKKIKRDHNQQFGSLITVSKRDNPGKSRENLNRRSTPVSRERKKVATENLGNFDVYNIETAMPTIDLEAIESHLKAAREEERRRRTDREEIRRRLAMGAEEDYFSDRPGKKPSLQARLQSGMNLQICFMNENVSDTESPNSDSENPVTNSKEHKKSPQLKGPSTMLSNNNSSQAVRPATLAITESQTLASPASQESESEGDFFTRQAKLQTEARMALAQAKEMARMQMELERQHQVKSPITEMVRNSLEKVGIPFPEEKRRLSRQILTEMNIAQLQVIVNDLHTQIETLNETLVKFLMERDDLHMEQDSMLVDIEDLTRYFEK